MCNFMALPSEIVKSTALVVTDWPGSTHENCSFGSKQATRPATTCQALGVGWQFRRRRKIGPGLTLNVGKRSGSLSVGPRGAKLNVGRKGLAGTVTLLGTGLSYAWRRRR
jgi:hypothetical protein